MKKLNYRHSIETLNKNLESRGEWITYAMQDGKPLYTLHEKIDHPSCNSRTCGYFYSATDAAEYVNKVNGLAS